MRRLVLSAAVAIAALVCQADRARAGVTFTFTESGGTVLMQSSGVLDTSKLVAGAVAGGISGRGIETNIPPQSDIMGDGVPGHPGVGFAFHPGTNLAPWIGGLFAQSDFNWNGTGTTQFTTYIFPGLRVPGIEVGSEDLVGNLWTPDIAWTHIGPATFASLGLTTGSYTITDVETGEFISIQVGDAVATPEPGSLALLSAGLIGLGALRRRTRG